eukprot:2410918-Rhodomonas_salina.2
MGRGFRVWDGIRCGIRCRGVARSVGSRVHSLGCAQAGPRDEGLFCLGSRSGSGVSPQTCRVERRSRGLGSGSTSEDKVVQHTTPSRASPPTLTTPSAVAAYARSVPGTAQRHTLSQYRTLYSRIRYGSTAHRIAAYTMPVAHIAYFHTPEQHRIAAYALPVPHTQHTLGQHRTSHSTIRFCSTAHRVAAYLGKGRIVPYATPVAAYLGEGATDPPPPSAPSSSIRYLSTTQTIAAYGISVPLSASSMRYVSTGHRIGRSR